MSWNYAAANPAGTSNIEHLNGLYRYAMILSRNHHEAEELVQETYTRAMPTIRSLRPDSNIKGLLFTILKNIWINGLRKQRSRPQIIEIDVGTGVADNIIGPSRDLHEVYVSKLETEQVRAAIHKLPVAFREIILLRVDEDLSYREIAGILRCPVGTVMSRLGRARAKLRTLLSAPAASKGS